MKKRFLLKGQFFIDRMSGQFNLCTMLIIFLVFNVYAWLCHFFDKTVYGLGVTLDGWTTFWDRICSNLADDFVVGCCFEKVDNLVYCVHLNLNLLTWSHENILTGVDHILLNLLSAFSCDPGQYVDVTSPTLECKKCPKGTYSVGGGVQFSDWTTLPMGFETTSSDLSYHSYYYDSEYYGERKGVNCSEWVAFPVIFKGCWSWYWGKQGCI